MLARASTRGGKKDKLRKARRARVRDPSHVLSFYYRRDIVPRLLRLIINEHLDEGRLMVARARASAPDAFARARA